LPERALPQERVQALAMIFAHLPATDQQRYIDEYQKVADEAHEGVWVVRQGSHMVAAALVQAQPGYTAVLHVPQGATHAALGPLLTWLVERLQADGVRLVQTLLALPAGDETQSLRQAGFTHAANLLYLVSTRSVFPTQRPASELEFCPFFPADERRLAEIVERTYIGSLDCPQLESLRDVKDVLSGYRAVGRFDPSRWLIARHRGVDVGCVLLAEHEGAGQWELTYLGVVPEARSQSFGLTLVRQAQWLARQGGCERLVLAVDGNNRPALDVYAAAKFVAWDERRVYLRTC
jgi:ribosomal protein S18 acetylase RimI-like enzyme